MLTRCASGFSLLLDLYEEWNRDVIKLRRIFNFCDAFRINLFAEVFRPERHKEGMSEID